MSHVGTGDLLPSDEEDGDYVPDLEEESSSDEEGFHEDSEKKEAPKPGLSKDELDAVWKSFNEPENKVGSERKNESQGNNSNGSEKTRSTGNDDRPTKKVKITRVYEYAKEKITDEVEVDEDSIEAQEWLKKNQGQSNASSEQKTSTETKSIETASTTANNNSTVESSTPKPAPSFKRKPRSSLASMNASLSKPKKLNTLEKSKLDWDKYVTKNNLGDDMQQNRKQGYLDKQDFLQRTDERKEEVYEAARANQKRR